MVEYLSCEYLNSKHFTFSLVKIIIIHNIFTFHILLAKYSNWLKIQPIIFNSFYFALKICFHKFSGSKATLFYFHKVGVSLTSKTDIFYNKKKKQIYHDVTEPPKL